MVVKTTEAASVSNSAPILFALGPVVSILSLIICIIILIHSLYNYRVIFSRHHQAGSRNAQSKTPYLMTIANIILAIFSICSFMIMRTTTVFFDPEFKNGEIQSFNPFLSIELQCKLGWVSFFFPSLLWFCSCPIIFLSRIRGLFKGSAYAFRPCVFKTFHAVIVLILLSHGVYGAIIPFEADWIIYHEEKFDIYYCGAEYRQRNKAFLTITTVITSLMVVCLDFSLLYMFVSGLWKLHKTMIGQFVTEHIEDEDKDQQDDDEDIDAVSQRHGTDMSMSIDIVITKYRQSRDFSRDRTMSNAAKRIFRLHNLVKKMTILMFISMLSNLAYITFLAVEPMTSQIFGMPMTIKVVCIWLMCANASRYWMCCQKYGICACCYLNVNDIRGL